MEVPPQYEVQLQDDAPKSVERSCACHANAKQAKQENFCCGVPFFVMFFVPKLTLFPLFTHWDLVDAIA